MLGTDMDAGIFDPTDTLTRAQMAQILYNMAGSPAVEGSAPYTDCEQGAWYDAAVTWCAQEGIFQGYDGTSLFGPDGLLSREQMAVVLWRMAGTASADGDLSHFVDGASVSDWAADGVSWAVGEGYLRGIGGTSELRPQDGLERAQAATVLMRADRAGFPFPEPAEQPR